MVGQSDLATSECKALLGQALGRLNARLADFLKELGIPEPAHEAREELITRWNEDRVTPGEHFRTLNVRRIQGLVDESLIFEMVFAAREEAARCLDQPSTALEWLFRAENCLGYLEALSGITQQSEQKSQAAKKSNSSQRSQALKADVLAFVERHQPQEGWDLKQAIQSYVGQPYSETSPLIQAQGYDEYWVDVERKLKSCFSDKAFSAAFKALLRR
jgi:hypothetical protein